MDQDHPRSPSRRDFFKTGGALVVSFGLPLADAAAADGADATVPLDALDSWIAIGADGRVVASVGKIEAGMGISTAFAQIVAEELDLPLDRITIRMGDTASTPDQRGTGSSNGITQGGSALRAAGAEARAALVALAARQLNVAADKLVVKDGVISVDGDVSRRVGYGELIGERRFDVKVNVKTRTKDPRQYQVVGKAIPRIDIPEKVTARYAYMVDLAVPGMLHGRVLRPPEARAKFLRFDAAQELPGLIKVVIRGDFVGVVCQREEQAIRAAQELRVEWSKPEPTFSADYDALYDHLRSASAKVSKVEENLGDVDAALAAAVTLVEARYEYPFQSHASMGPACAVADVRADGVTVWMGGQKPYPLRSAVADLLQVSLATVRVIWQPGPGSYGMNDADDAAMDAVLLSQAVGRPVRLQYMRHDGTAWDPKGPPAAYRLRGALDARGNVVAFDYLARGYSSRIRPSGTEFAADSLAGQLSGMKPKSVDLFQFASEAYQFPNKRKTSDIIAWEQSIGTALRTAHLRDPDGPSTCFASESFVDELAAAARADPVAFRLRHLDGRDRSAVEAVAEAAKWETRAAPNPNRSGPLLKGRGIAYAPRNGTIVAIVAEVEVEKATGIYRVTRFTVAHDCGFVVNPGLLKATIEANLIQTMSRAMHEQVLFDASRVTSVDWASYPIVDMTEVPDAIDIVLLNNRPDAQSRGAGEPASRPTVAAIANALFDATGVRLRRVPFTPDILRAALPRT